MPKGTHSSQKWMFAMKQAERSIYLRGTHTHRGREPSSLLAHSPKCLQWLGLGLEAANSFQDSAVGGWQVPHYLPVCACNASWNQEESPDLNLGSLLWDVGIPSCALTNAPNTCSSYHITAAGRCYSRDISSLSQQWRGILHCI